MKFCKKKSFILLSTALVFLKFSVLGFTTALFIMFTTSTIDEATYTPQKTSEWIRVFSFETTKPNQIVKFTANANMSYPSQAFVEGILLDKDKKYFFSFGQKLWNDSVSAGTRVRGSRKSNNDFYSIHFLLKEPQTYYVVPNFTITRSETPTSVTITLSKMWASHLPHMWFGVFCFLIGILFTTIVSHKKHRAKGGSILGRDVYEKIQYESSPRLTGKVALWTVLPLCELIFLIWII